MPEVDTSRRRRSARPLSREKIAVAALELARRGRELLFSTQALLHQITAIAESEVLARGTSREGNWRFAEAIGFELSEEVRAAWPQRAPQSSGLFDFDTFFAYSMQIHLTSIEADLASQEEAGA